ncbi:MAG TPA: aminoglycoside phosphotransferase family protein [Polyangia bacterium]|nr:aminoglycoside phosphotransferase family protein [Polyangia bacterium]
MKADDAPDIDAILREHGVFGAWQPLPSRGIANRVYATDAVVVRVALDEPDALADAHTESIAAPAAHAAGVLSPRLLAFDESRRLATTPYSLWERVGGEPLGAVARRTTIPAETWRAIGRELARLHAGVRACPDPRGWLDTPSLGDPREALVSLATRGQLVAPTVRWLDGWIRRLAPLVTSAARDCFVHDDLHEMNLMCRADGVLTALIDWGDAGWGDPALDFAALPIDGMPDALAAYETSARGLVGDGVEARVLWARLTIALEKLAANPRRDGKLRELVRFAREPSARWRALTLAPPVDARG